MIQKIIKRIGSSVIAALIIIMVIPNVGAQELRPNENQSMILSDTYDYSDYILKTSATDYAGMELCISNEKVKAVDGAKIDLQPDGALLWKNGEGELSFQIEVQSDALYNFKMEFKSVDVGTDYALGIKIDSKYPFAGSEKIVFNRLWENNISEYRYDSQGNQISPEQVEVSDYISSLAKDNTGVATEPYKFHLTEGVHTVSVVSPLQSISIKAIKFIAIEEALSYEKVFEKNLDRTTNADIIYIEGENAILKSDSSLIPKSDNSNAGMSPSSAISTKLNYIGGTSWNKPNQTITWNFKVEKSGYYYFVARYRQSDVINAESWRKLYIDGKIPFKEANSLRFAYSPSWNNYTFGGKDPYYFYLSEGNHTLTLEVTLGSLAEYYNRLSKIVQILGDEYINIVKITGAQPDLNLDYELFTQIPTLKKNFEICKNELKKFAEDLQNFTGERGNQYISAVNNMSRVVDKMLDNPYMAHQYVEDYYNSYASVSSWLYDMKSMPLCIDVMQLVPFGKQYNDTGKGFFKKIGFTVKRLVSSFTKNYTIEKTESETNLKLWVNWGRDQASVLDALVRDSFTQKTGVNVDIKITNASYVNGILSGNCPDLALYMSRTEPLNLGMRGALCDLRQFSDVDEVLSRFNKDADVPYRLGNKLYALPDSQSFFLMFYRSDILENLGLSVPKTWDEFTYTAAIIQRNNMSVYVPYTMISDSTTVNSGIGSLNLYPTLMLQNNLALYNEEKSATNITSPQAINVFDNWTKMYTDYGYLKEADFYNRLRVGIMPLGIAPYTLYMTLYNAAPEIAGRWSIALVPGTTGGNDSVAGAGTGCAILNKSKHKEEAWEFLKWWTSAEIQTKYSRNIESILGMLGRPQTATVDALTSLAWDKNDLSIILEQWSKVVEQPEVPGGYYLSRALDQAFWSVLNDKVTAKDAIVKWSDVANGEIARKIKEYS